MASPSYTYTLTNATTADASQVQQNFTDILNGVSDGTKDLSISALTCAGTANLTGAVTLGNSAAKDITFTGSLASTVPVKTNNSFDIGSATLGLASVYLGNGGAGATCRVVSASHATTRTYTIPDCATAANFVMTEVAQSKNGAMTFNSGVVLGGGTTLGFYQVGTTETTWASDSAVGVGGSMSTTTLNYVKIGTWVSLEVPGKAGQINTNQTRWKSVTPLPSWAFPGNPAKALHQKYENGVGNTSAMLIVDSSGLVSIYRDGAISTWTSGLSGGLDPSGGTYNIVYRGT